MAGAPDTAPAVSPSHSRSNTRTLAEAFDPHRNSLSFLRLVFAAMVLLDHAFPTGGFHSWRDPMWGWTNGQESFGGLAVAGFFVVSGFLVTRSFVGSSNSLRYLWKRFLRIMPGFWICLLITIGVFAPIAYSFSHGTLSGYLNSQPESPWSYLSNNWYLNVTQYNIDGLLSTTPYQHSGYTQAFDGSLWTLIYEFKCYIGVAVLGVLGLYRRWRFSIVLIAFLLWFLQLEEVLHPGRFHGFFLFGDPNMSLLAFIFSLGMVFYLYREKIPISDGLAVVALGVLVVSMRTELYYGVGLFMLAYLCMWGATRIPVYNADRYGDFSYGLYIYAFPVEQLLALYHLNRWGLIPFVMISLVLSVLVSILSWFAIEKPAMRLKNASISRQHLLRVLPGRMRPSRTFESEPVGLLNDGSAAMAMNADGRQAQEP